MQDSLEYLDKSTIEHLGFKRSDVSWSAWTGPSTRVYEYPGLVGVYVMDSDLYGNPMYQGSCFLALVDEHGVIGLTVTINELLSSTAEQILNMFISDPEREKE